MKASLAFLIILVVAALFFEAIPVRSSGKEEIIPLPLLAEKIRKGEIDPGQRFGMDPEGRFHKIHAVILGLECTQCHLDRMPVRIEVFLSSPPAGSSPDAPGSADRRACLGCHLTGPGKSFYGD